MICTQATRSFIKVIQRSKIFHKAISLCIKISLDGLLEVSPAVKKYKRIADIISYQLRIVKGYKTAFDQFKLSKYFTTAEIEYLGKVILTC
jgi:hypothetical protein